MHSVSCRGQGPELLETRMPMKNWMLATRLRLAVVLVLVAYGLFVSGSSIDWICQHPRRQRLDEKIIKDALLSVDLKFINARRIQHRQNQRAVIH